MEEQVKDCQICSLADKTASPRHAPLQPVPFPGEPWAKLGLDFIGPMAGGRPGQRFAIVAIDYHSKWIEVGFCEHPTSEVVIQFMEKLACREGYPKEIVSDCGSAFTSDRFTSYLRNVGVSHIKVSPYHPQSSGQVERANKTVKAALQTADLEKADRAQYLQMFLFAYRSTVQATTGRSPAELLHGRPMRGKLSAALDVGGRRPPRTDDLQDRVKQRRAYQKAYFDRTHGVKTPDFGAGSPVRHRLPPQARKGRLRFSPTKTILQRRGPASYLLDDGTRVHADRLTRGRGSSRAGPETSGADQLERMEAAEPARESGTAGAAVAAEPGRQDEEVTKDDVHQPMQPGAETASAGIPQPGLAPHTYRPEQQPDTETVASGGGRPTRPGADTVVTTKSGRAVYAPVRYGFDT